MLLYRLCHKIGAIDETPHLLILYDLNGATHLTATATELEFGFLFFFFSGGWVTFKNKILNTYL